MPAFLNHFLLSLFVSFTQSLTFKITSLKFKEKTTDLDTKSYKYLLLAVVKLIHADPKLLLHVSIVCKDVLFILSLNFNMCKTCENICFTLCFFTRSYSL